MVMALASEFILHGWHRGVIVKSQTNMLCSQVLCMQVEGNSDLSGLKPPLPQNEAMFSTSHFFFLHSNRNGCKNQSNKTKRANLTVALFGVYNQPV